MALILTADFCSSAFAAERGRDAELWAIKQHRETSGFTERLTDEDGPKSKEELEFPIMPLSSLILWASTQVLLILINVVNQALTFKGIRGNLPAKS